MNRKAYRTVSAVAAFAAFVLFHVPAAAQAARMRVDVPFQFMAAGAMLPAGTYFINLSEESRTLVVEGSQQFIRVPVTVVGTRRGAFRLEKGALLFQGIGRVYVLRSAWNPNRREGCSLYPSKAERELSATTKGASSIAWAR